MSDTFFDQSPWVIVTVMISWLENCTISNTYSPGRVGTNSVRGALVDMKCYESLFLLLLVPLFLRLIWGWCEELSLPQLGQLKVAENKTVYRGGPDRIRELIAMGAYADVGMEAIQRRLMFGDECVLVDENDRIVGHDTKYHYH